MLPTVQIPQSSLTVPNTVAPVRPTQGVIDVLSEFIPGQKLLAQVQAQLANGAYRATIAQRDVTLALPFSAKAGDTLELEVVETQGKIAFAVSRSKADAEGAAQQSSATTLSRTGQMIARLLSGPDQQAGRGTVLNQGRALLENPTATGRENAPALQQAVSKSGLFYESHLANWVGGKLAEQALRGEPQAALSQALRQNVQNSGERAAGGPNPGPGTSAPAGNASPTPAPLASGPTPLAKPLSAPPGGLSGAPAGQDMGSSASASEAGKASAAARGGLPAEVAPLVQQQLSSLANNVYAFQALAWAGQPINWELIDDEAPPDQEQAGDGTHPWKTRLKMLLPSLGDIDALIQLEGNDVSIRVTSGADHTRATLHSGIDRLRERMELAGLRLFALDIRPPEVTPESLPATLETPESPGNNTPGTAPTAAATSESARDARKAYTR